MKSCVIFDFDGVIADTEEQHFEGFNEALAELSAKTDGPLVITSEQYLTRYFAYGDREAFREMLTDNGRPTGDALVGELIETKAVIMRRLLAQIVQPLPGVLDVLDMLDTLGVPRAICSSARRAEIEQVLAAANLADRFELTVAIEDVANSKPAPECYRKAFAALNDRHGGVLESSSSMAIEDSAGGSRAARGAGLRVMGIATNLPLAEIAAAADWAVESFVDTSIDEWREWLHLSK